LAKILFLYGQKWKFGARLLILIGLLISSFRVNGQESGNDIRIKGYIHSDAKYYLKDPAIGFDKPVKSLRSNTYGDIRLAYKRFSAGLRYEAYLPPLIGYSSLYEGQGIANLFGAYSSPVWTITAGSFYEQFGSGLILRSYENHDLGIDNSLLGTRITYSPFKGLTFKTLIGKQKNYWALGKGLVRGIDTEWNVSETFGKSAHTAVMAGFSFVSRFQKDRDPLYRLPENVAAFSGRFSLYHAEFQLSGEYGYKINDPSAVNNLIYKNGQAVLISGSYAIKGFGFLVSGKWIDNMDFRSERGAVGQALTLGFVPSAFSEHSYSLQAMYPYTSQPMGEATLHSEVTRTLPKNTWWGGKYGTTLVLHLASANSIKKEPLHPLIPIGSSGTTGYRSSFAGIGKDKYFRDVTFEITRKISPAFKSVAGFSRIFYSKSILEGHPGEPDVKACIIFADMTFKMSPTSSFRTEIQHLRTKQDKGSWAMFLCEYSLAPHWIISLNDPYNYGNPVSNGKDHYPLLSIHYNRNAHSINLLAGRQREGLICIGGVCRYSPASTGFGLIYTLTL
jgi:hypothetical protein